MSRIPKTLHYVFGMSPDFGGKLWSLVHHICVSSAIAHIKPDRVRFAYAHEPTGPWWELTRKIVTPIRIEAPTEIFGRPLHHVAHKADVVRLQTLIEHGGIYLDADVLVQRSFDDLLHHSTVLGQEGIGGEHGLANAVILAEPQAPFLRRWMAHYSSFRSAGNDAYWNEHSVRLPSRLAAAHPEDITVLGHTAFFWPTWTKPHLAWMFRSNRPISLENTYANHLWEARAWEDLRKLTLAGLRTADTNFAGWARPHIDGLLEQEKPLSIAARAAHVGQRIMNYAGMRAMS